MAKPIRIGIIGTGIMGSDHVATLQKLPEYQLTCICDIRPEILKKLQAEQKIPATLPVYTDYKEMLDAGLCDAVGIAVPHPLHLEITEAAFAHGLHVLCEKPITVRVSDSDRAIEAHRRSGKLFVTNFSMRTTTVNQVIKQWMDEKRLGKIARVEFTCTEWLRPQAYYDTQSWRGTWNGEGGGLLMNQAPHNLDLLWWWFGDLKSCTAKLEHRFHKIETEDEVTATLNTKAGFPIHFYATTAEFPGKDYLEIVGDAGTLIRENGELKFRKLSSSMFEAITNGPWPQTIKYEDTKVEFEPKERGAKIVWIDFAKCINGEKEQLLTPGDEGIHAVEYANAMTLSHFTKREIEFPVNRQEFDTLLKELQEKHRAL